MWTSRTRTPATASPEAVVGDNRLNDWFSIPDLPTAVTCGPSRRPHAGVSA